MKECCDNCKRKYKIRKLDYSQGGCIHTLDIGGFACTAFADEGAIEWMVGLDGSCNMCEAFDPIVKENNNLAVNDTNFSAPQEDENGYYYCYCGNKVGSRFTRDTFCSRCGRKLKWQEKQRWLITMKTTSV